MAVTASDVYDWLEVANPGGAKEARMTRILAAVIEKVDERCFPWPGADADPPAPVRPADVELAVIMWAARLSKRATSPEGVAGYDDLGPVRILRIDPDIADMLADHLLPVEA